MTPAGAAGESEDGRAGKTKRRVLKETMPEKTLQPKKRENGRPEIRNGSPDASGHNGLPGLGARSIRALETAGRPLSIGEVYEHLNEDGFGRVMRLSLKSRLSSLCARGRIQRFATGVYAAAGLERADFAAELRLPLEKRITRLFAAAERPLTNREILGMIETEYGRPIARDNVASHLSILAKKGRIRRLARGLYADADFDASGFEIAGQPTLGERIVRLLESKDQPFPTKQVVLCLAEDGHGSVHHPSVATCLTGLYGLGRIQRLAFGVYSNLSFDETSFDTFNALALAEVVNSSDRPLKRQAVAALFNDAVAGRYSLKYVGKLLSAAGDCELVRRLPEGLYCGAEYSPAGPAAARRGEKAHFLRPRIIRVLESAAGPLENAEIVARLDGDGFGRVHPGSVRSRLSHEGRRGSIKRLATGLYAGVGFNEADYDPAERLTIEERIVRLLAKAGVPLDRPAILEGVNGDGLGELEKDSLGSRLSVAFKKGLIRRLAEGVYASPDYDARNYLPPAKENLRQKAVRFVDGLGRQAATDEIVEGVNRMADSDYSKDWVSRCLSAACRQGEIKRLVNGVYAPAGYELPYEAAAGSIEKRVAKFLKDSGGAAKLSLIVEGLENDGFGNVRTTSITNQLASDRRRGRIKKIARGVYALADFEGEYAPPEKDTRVEKVVTVLRETGRPMRGEDVQRHIRQTTGEKYDLAAIGSSLGYAAKKQLVRRLNAGVYAAPGVELTPENNPRGPDVVSRIDRALERAGGILRAGEVFEAVNGDGGRPISRTTIDNRLSAGCRQGRYKRWARGAYSDSSFEGPAGGFGGRQKPAKPKGKPAGQRRQTPAEKARRTAAGETKENVGREQNRTERKILEIFAENGGPLKTAEVARLVDAAQAEGCKTGRLGDRLGLMCREGLILRLRPGIYAGLDFDVETYERNSELDGRILRVLAKAKKVVETVEIHRRLLGDGRAEVEMEELRGRLKALRRENRLNHRRPNLYSDRRLRITNANAPAAISIGRKVAQLVDSWGADGTVEDIIIDLENAGFEDLDRRTIEPIIESRLRRKRRLAGAA